MVGASRASRSVACCVALGWDGIGTTRYEAERDETRRNGTKRDDGYHYGRQPSHGRRRKSKSKSKSKSIGDDGMGWRLRARVSSESSRVDPRRAGIGFTLGCCRPVCAGVSISLRERTVERARTESEKRTASIRSVVSRTPHWHHPTYPDNTADFARGGLYPLQRNVTRQ